VPRRSSLKVFNAILLGQLLVGQILVITSRSASNRLSNPRRCPRVRGPRWSVAHAAGDARDGVAAEWRRRARRVQPLAPDRRAEVRCRPEALVDLATLPGHVLPRGNRRHHGIRRRSHWGNKRGQIRPRSPANAAAKSIPRMRHFRRSRAGKSRARGRRQRSLETISSSPPGALP